MTQAELDALPEASALAFSYREETRVGKRVRIPFVAETIGALYMGPDDGEVMDESGQRWLIGWANGTRFKRRLYG